ncbi:DinB family protein [Chitinophaga sp. HK235]|uniref:DinB family protein n=1 Tax=Chitinophaga sp. HK235 TaxID=2952571 RepID=UPI001BAA5552|nr:DinB family protein [Chitinophaga sp. HK235]
MENTIATNEKTITALTSKGLREHWEGHRRLTRRLLEAFPEEHFFSYSIGGMRPVAALAMELINITGPGIPGAATGNWNLVARHDLPSTKQAILDLWDQNTALISEYWPQITEERFQEEDVAFGNYPGTVISLLMYFIDNEIHHRGQIYVYFRALGLEAAPFYER